jgi:hypothetical protein
MVPASCSLDETGLSEQLGRYRAAGDGAEVLVRDARRITVRVGEQADTGLIDELIATERSCCPFYELSYDAGEGQLTIAVATEEHEPALAAIAHALGLPTSA